MIAHPRLVLRVTVDRIRLTDLFLKIRARVPKHFSEPRFFHMAKAESKGPSLRPLYDRVLVRRVDSETTTKGGLIIPDTAKEKPLEGEVVAVGNGRVLEDGSLRPMTVKAGDRVLFAKYAETEVKVGAENFLLLREEDLLGILER